MTVRSQRVLSEHAVEMAHFQCAIPQFAESTAHSSVPLDDPAAAARSGGQERPQAGACALLLTGASTAACSPFAASSSMRSMLTRCMLISLIAVLSSRFVGSSTAQNLTADPVIAGASNPSDPYSPFIVEASRRFSIPDHWIRAVMQVESGGNPRAVSKRAVGLMQIKPATWRGLQERYALGADLYDPHDNIIAGTAYLREMYDRFGPDGFLAAYNAGPERYLKFRDAGVPLPVETQLYVAMLGPQIDGSPSALLASRSAEHYPWQSSSLFANTSDNTKTSFASRPAHPSRDTAVVDLSALMPMSRDLFVARPRGNEVP